MRVPEVGMDVIQWVTKKDPASHSRLSRCVLSGSVGVGRVGSSAGVCRPEQIEPASQRWAHMRLIDPGFETYLEHDGTGSIVGEGGWRS